MGALTTSGMVSGLGQGLERGFGALSQGFMQIAQGQQRDQMEERRLQLTFGHRDKLQAEQLASQEKIASQREAGEDRRLDQNIAAHATDTDKKIASDESLAGKKLAHDELMKGQELTSLEARANREYEQKEKQHAESVGVQREKIQADAATDRERNATTRQHNQDWRDVMFAQIAARKGDDHDLARAERYGKFLMHELDMLRDQLKDAYKEEDKTRIWGQINAIQREYKQLFKIQEPEGATKNRIVDPYNALSIVDPWKKTSPAQTSRPPAAAPTDWNAVGRAMAPDPMGVFQAPSGSSRQPTNVAREGRQRLAEAQAALDSAKASQADPSVIHQLQRTVDDLTARWGR